MTKGELKAYLASAEADAVPDSTEVFVCNNHDNGILTPVPVVSIEYVGPDVQIAPPGGINQPARLKIWSL